MALATAMNCRARVLRQDEEPIVVYNEPQRRPPTPGTWFRCRLDDVGASMQVSGDDTDPIYRYVKRPTLLILKHDVDFKRTEVRASDQLELQRRDFSYTGGWRPLGVWQVDGRYKDQHKRVALNHFEAQVTKITDDASGVPPDEATG